MSKLNAKQQRFVDEYLVDLNATKAAIRAGYSERSAENQGSRMMRNDEVKAAIAKAMGAREERVHADQDYVIDVIIETVEKCRGAKPTRIVTLEKDDKVKDVEIFVFDPANALKGADMLAKHLNMEIGKDKLVVEDARKAEDEIDALIEAYDPSTDSSQALH